MSHQPDLTVQRSRLRVQLVLEVVLHLLGGPEVDGKLLLLGRLGPVWWIVGFLIQFLHRSRILSTLPMLHRLGKLLEGACEGECEAAGILEKEIEIRLKS